MATVTGSGSRAGADQAVGVVQDTDFAAASNQQRNIGSPDPAAIDPAALAHASA